MSLKLMTRPGRVLATIGAAAVLAASSVGIATASPTSPGTHADTTTMTAVKYRVLVQPRFDINHVWSPWGAGEIVTPTTPGLNAYQQAIVRGVQTGQFLKETISVRVSYRAAKSGQLPVVDATQARYVRDGTVGS